MKPQKLIIASFLTIGFFSSSAFADIENISTTATASINLSLTVPSTCKIVGLDATSSNNINPANGQVTIPGIKSVCNNAGARPKIAFSSQNDFKLVSADSSDSADSGTKTKENIPYSVTFGTTEVSSTTETMDITPQGADLKMSVTPSALVTKSPGTYSDILTAAITL